MSSQTKLIKDILSIYDTILENNKVSEAIDIYDNVDFKNIGQGNPSSDNINITLLQDIESAAKAAGVKVDITTAISGHEHLPSRHPSGNAVDIAMINGKAVSPSNREDADKLVKALVSMGYVKNSESGNDKAVLTFGFPNHDNHVHVSNTTGKPSEPSNSSPESNDKSDNKSNDKTETDNNITSTSDFQSDPLIRQFGDIINQTLGLDKGLTENIDRIKGLIK